MSGDIFLNIDRIVLHGLGHVDRSELQTALQTALKLTKELNRLDIQKRH